MSPSTSPSQSPAAPVELELRVQGSRGPVNQRYLFVNALLVANDELVQVVVDITELPVFGLSAGAVLRIEAVEEPSRTRQGLRGFQAVRLLQLRPPVNGTAENAAAVKKAHCTGAPSLCKFWVRRGQCGTLGCTFRHGALSQTEEEAVRARRQQVRVAVDADDPHAADDKRQHARRHAVFADWLLSTFGRDALDGGGGVLDIAGGRGALAFELVARGVRTTLVEPRPRVTLTARQKRRLRKLQAQAQEGAQAQAPGWASVSPLGFTHVRALLDGEFAAAEAGHAILSSCSALVGLHPDQATDGLVDAAVRFGKPFAVVPCCVFPSLFPQRRRADGSTVRSYDELCGYLMERAEGTHVAYLPVAGRNRVLYRTAATAPQPSRTLAVAARDYVPQSAERQQRADDG